MSAEFMTTWLDCTIWAIRNVDRASFASQHDNDRRSTELREVFRKAVRISFHVAAETKTHVSNKIEKHFVSNISLLPSCKIADAP